MSERAVVTDNEQKSGIFGTKHSRHLLYKEKLIKSKPTGK